MEAIYLIAVLLGPGNIEFDVRYVLEFESKPECIEYVEKDGHGVVRGISHQYHFEQSIDDTGQRFSVPLEKIYLVCTPISIDKL